MNNGEGRKEGPRGGGEEIKRMRETEKRSSGTD